MTLYSNKQLTEFELDVANIVWQDIQLIIANATVDKVVMDMYFVTIFTNICVRDDKSIWGCFATCFLCLSDQCINNPQLLAATPYLFGVEK